VHAVHAQQAAALSADAPTTFSSGRSNGERNGEKTSTRGLKIFFRFLFGWASVISFSLWDSV
jgi:hypothetical protein